ncbi:uncharacterized protein LAESUDRAFT_731231 [Laetiporus sulphureus 93-53]|uniref:Uncharacterized protein n=1 Tax=Laetiporus sulphureus 93-53 TaxID=1314785 RepID=A0A165BNU0_9APHY|nr:uncharacterized protein LAESUDRAFT_731231 [Laetiporus sulphureus 93-53]KZT01382.1 hypothetical protein LAESUDRAFT_731231 [Laetiporus sulphureus 93-53]
MSDKYFAYRCIPSTAAPELAPYAGKLSSFPSTRRLRVRPSIKSCSQRTARSFTRSVALTCGPPSILI